ncbi:MAG: hypothetical protein JXQ83_13455, partial [Candidatus Glassbacteria bacterium]|nr:hypothetical protein [Candidatus Glassbacteria bacterium]
GSCLQKNKKLRLKQFDELVSSQPHYKQKIISTTTIMVHFLKYVSCRLLLGTFTAVLVVYRVLAWVHEVLYAGRTLDDRWLILWSYLSCLVLVSLAMSLWGRLRFNRKLAGELDRIRAQYHPKILVKAFRHLVGYLGSCYFINWSRTRLRRSLALRFGGVLLGMRIDDDEALAIYEEVLQFEPENENFYRFLIFAYSRRAQLSERSFQYLRRRYHERPDDRLVGVLSREYTTRKVLNFESERVLERCTELYPEHRHKVLKFVIPRLLHFQRMDDNAVRFYLSAFEAGWVSGAKERLEEIRRRYREKGRRDALALRVENALSGREARPVDSSTGSAGEAARPVPGPAEYRPVDGEEFQLTGLVYSDDEEGQFGQASGGRPEMSWGSRLYGFFQRLFTGGRSASGNFGKWARIVLLLILAAVLVYFLLPLAGIPAVKFF